MLQILQNWAKSKYPWKIWAIPFVLISPAALLIPNNVFTQYPWASTLTDWVTAVVPMINRTAHLHPHPDKFRAFYAYAWAWLPLLLWLAKVQLSIKKEEFEVFCVAHLRHLSWWLVMVVVLGGIAMLFYVPGDGGISLSLMTQADSRARFYSSDISLLWVAPVSVYYTALLYWLGFYFLRVAFCQFVIKISRRTLKDGGN